LRLIKRYPNRKLYDTKDRRYISLEGVASLVRAGEEIQVVATEDGTDITTFVLSQVLREQEREGSFLPRSLLSSLVGRSSGSLSRLRSAFDASLKGLQALEQEVQESIDSLADRGEITLAEAQQLREELLARSREAQADLEARMLRDIEESLFRLQLPTRSDLTRLYRRLEQIETKIDSLVAASDRGHSKSST
jgi:polyhydroxyalkanoate synthesis repressor PhaR